MAVDAAKLGIPLPADWVDAATCVLLTEFILTFLLMTAIFGTAVDERGKAVKIGGFGDRPDRGVRHSGRRAGHRRVDEPGPLVRAGARVQLFRLALVLLGRADRRGDRRRAVVRARAARQRTRTVKAGRLGRS